MSAPRHRPATALSVAGSDPSGGAGIQADLKTFSALGVYGCAVLTALTAQSTRGVSAVHAPPADFVGQQLDTLFEDVTVDAVKIGMLADADIATVVSGRLGQWREDNPEGAIVLDPVMISTSGHPLLADDAVAVVRDVVFGVADLVTPNLPEAAFLLGEPSATTVDEMKEQATALRRFGAQAVLLKGGHLLAHAPGQQPLALGVAAQAVDVLADASGVHAMARDAVDTANTHGTGCTLSSALAALAAGRIHRGAPIGGLWRPVVDGARDYLTAALAGGAGWRLGEGSGPVDHLVWARAAGQAPTAARG